MFHPPEITLGESPMDSASNEPSPDYEPFVGPASSLVPAPRHRLFAGARHRGPDCDRTADDGDVAAASPKAEPRPVAFQLVPEPAIAPKPSPRPRAATKVKHASGGASPKTPKPAGHRRHRRRRPRRNCWCSARTSSPPRTFPSCPPAVTAIRAKVPVPARTAAPPTAPARGRAASGSIMPNGIASPPMRSWPPICRPPRKSAGGRSRARRSSIIMSKTAASSANCPSIRLGPGNAPGLVAVPRPAPRIGGHVVIGAWVRIRYTVTVTMEKK